MGWADESVASGYWWQTTDLSTLVLALLPVWLLGACIGLLVSHRAQCIQATSSVDHVSRQHSANPTLTP